MAQFALLVAINALVGGMVGQQQTVLPLLAETEFGLTGYTFIFTYVAAFGITKAIANWRDLGYAVGAILGGIMGLHAAVWAAAAVSALSALVVAVRMYETHQPAPITPHR